MRFYPAEALAPVYRNSPLWDVAFWYVFSTYVQSMSFTTTKLPIEINYGQCGFSFSKAYIILFLSFFYSHKTIQHLQSL